LEKLHACPDEAVCIDDNDQYVQGARDAGLHALRFKSPRALRRDLAALGVAVALP
jgi:FMN phosphatase YigB (HAD superfamily)